MKNEDQTGTEEQAPKPAPLHAWIKTECGSTLRRIHIFDVGDYDWFAAIDIDGALKAFQDHYSYTNEEFAEVKEDDNITVNLLNEDELDETDFEDEDLEDPISFRTKLQQMIDAGHEFPCHFATTEI